MKALWQFKKVILDLTSHPYPILSFVRSMSNISYSEKFDQQIRNVKSTGNYRKFANVTIIPGKFPNVRILTPSGLEREATVWGTVDVLNMAQNPAVKQACVRTVNECGVGAAGSRNLGGTHFCHVELENELAVYLNKEASLVFPSGYFVNLTAPAVLGSMLPNCVIFSARENHASLIHGIQNSKAEKKLFSHENLSELKELLASVPVSAAKLIVVEAVYSMSGTVTDIDGICKLAKRYNAITFLDEAHSFGLYGENGTGMAEQQGVRGQVDFFMGNFNKAVGTLGGFVAGPSNGIDVIRSYGRPFIFTGALPPGIINATRKSLEIIRSPEGMLARKSLLMQVSKFRTELEKAGIKFLPNDSHITPILIRGAQRCQRVAEKLVNEFGIYVQAVNYPSVPIGLERLRVAITLQHNQEQITYFVVSLKKCIEETA